MGVSSRDYMLEEGEGTSQGRKGMTYSSRDRQTTLHDGTLGCDALIAF